MIDLSTIDNIYLAPGYTDLRKSVDGCSAIVKYNMFLDPISRSKIDIINTVHFNHRIASITFFRRERSVE